MNRHIFLFVRWSMEEKTMSKLFISGGTVIDPETLSRFQADVLCAGDRRFRLLRLPRLY